MYKKRGRKILKISIVFGMILAILGIIVILIEKQIIYNLILYKLRYLLYCTLISIIGWYFYIVINILFEDKSKKSVKTVDTSKIKEFGLARWMHNEIKFFSKDKAEKTLKEFHQHFNCDNPKCDFLKNKLSKKIVANLEPAWVINSQYRTKDKNILKKPPVESEYEFYDGEDNILDVEKYKESMDKWKEDINQNHKNYNLIYHTLEKLHLLVLGATGSGKTQKIIFPGLVRNAKLPPDKQPVMVVTDPKGEIYEGTSGFLEKQGYDVRVLNFRDTTSSYSWNPLYVSWSYRRDAIEYKEKYTFVKTFTNIVSVNEYINKKFIELDGEKVQLKCSNHDLKNCVECIKEFEQQLFDNGWEQGEEIKLFVSNGRFHIDEYDFNTKVSNKIMKLKSQSEKEIMSLASIIIQPGGNADPFWTDAAKTFFIGIAVIMLEIMDKNINAMPLEKFNIVNVIKMMDEPNMDKWIEKYREVKNKNGEDSFGLNQIATTINSSEQTQKSIVTTAKASTTLYTFTSVQGLLCSTKNLINMEEIVYGDKPTVLYLIIPDDDKVFHPLVACFVDQLYKTSVKIADLNKINGRLSSATLSRQLQFYLDEFGNFPKIPELPQMITVARSRNIFFMLILQDYNQLKATYDEESKIIKSNCNANVYIRTNDSDTAEQLSKEYGETPIISFNITDKFKRNDSNTKKSKEETTSVTTVPLIRANEILNLDDNFMIVKKTGKNPALVHSIYAYQVNEFQKYMKYKKSFVPSNSINYKKDHYFNFVDKDFNEWVNLIGEDKEAALWEDLNNSINEEQLKVINLKEEFNNKSSEKEYHNYNYEQLLEEQNKIIRTHRRNRRNPELRKMVNNVDNEINGINKKTNNYNSIESIFYEIEEKFMDKKTMKDQIEKNYFKLEKIKEKYYEYSNILPSEMSKKEREEYNNLYEEQIKIAEENRLLLQKCKKLKF